MKTKLFHYCILVCLTLACVELLSYAYLSLGLKTGSPANIAEKLHEAAQEDAKLDDGGKPGRDIVGHPYYGYVHDTNNALEDSAIHVQGVNLGLNGEGEILREYYDDACNIAIIGGSVAHLFHAKEHESIKKFFQSLPENSGKTVNVFGFTNWGYKQPQQMIIVLDLIAQGAHFDYVINIDGLNEVAIPLGNNVPNGVSPFFPLRWDLFTRDEAETNYTRDKRTLRALNSLQAGSARLYRESGLKPFALQAVFFACHQVRAHVGKALLDRLSRAGATLTRGNNLVLNKSGSQVVNSAKPLAPNILPWLVLHWARASATLHNAVTLQNGKYYHILQPNQYVPESKPFTDQEAAKYVNPANVLSKLVPRFYPLLRRAGGVLEKSGVRFYDFTMLFREVGEELYVNDCCHFNQMGNDIFEHRLEELLRRDRQHAKPSQPVNTNAVCQGILEDQDISRDFFAPCSVDFDLFEDNPWFKVSNVLPQESPARKERWAVRDVHGVGFFSPDKRRMRLAASFLTVLAGQRVHIAFNGRVVPCEGALRIARDPFDYDSQNTVDVEMEARPGWNTLTVACDKHDPDQRNFSVLYTRFTLKAEP